MGRGCDFCAIGRGTYGQARVLGEEAAWVAFVPLHPATPGHTLVIPRLHVADLWSVDEALGSELMSASLRMGQAIQQALRPEGMNLITSQGGAAEQTVYHVHLHLVPRWTTDRLPRIWPSNPTTEDDLEESVLEDIRSAFLLTHRG